MWFVLTAKGMEALSSGSYKPLTVFISSTCYDLLDLRFELAVFLESRGHAVQLSNDPIRFTVDPTDDSIATCLQNVEASDVVICILDRRYGGILTKKPHIGISATEAEINYAHEKGIPTYTFIREQAMLEYNQLRRDRNATTFWVETLDKSRRDKWFGLAEQLGKWDPVQEQSKKPKRSNWLNQFRSSVDLKVLVQKHLTDFQRRPQSRLGDNE